MKRPTSTYRLQLRPEFGFDAVAEIAPYLADLGVSHVYLAPYLQAATGSTHGYDVVDHARVNDELGGQEAYERMCAALSANGLGQIVDTVPNHMAIPGRDNAWWWDVLKYGLNSGYADHFDINWSSVITVSSQRLLLPVLGYRYGDVLDRGELTIKVSHDEPVVAYFDSEFPITGLTDDESVNLDAFNSNKEMLHELLERQHYRLAYWRLASEELEYRRFFDINSLMALRMEKPEVFEACHALIKTWVDSGLVDGLRIDHVDGLADPEQYLQRVRNLLGDDGYLVVEKILEPGERLRASWPAQGTTGYDALRLVDGLFIDSANEQAFTDLYDDFTGESNIWEDVVDESKQTVIQKLFGSDISRLTTVLRSVCDQHAEARDFSLVQIRSVIEALLQTFSVYRTYVIPSSGFVNEDDKTVIEKAGDAALDLVDDETRPLIDFVSNVLLLKTRNDSTDDFVKRFQQTSGPIMAKGIEDTAGYRFNRLVALNEVGGDPDLFGVAPGEFHELAIEAARLWPERMVASTTHDTKRSEDVRYRLALLSEMPEEWAAAVTNWSHLAERHKTSVDGEQWPDRNTEYLIYQTSVGAHPIDVDRLTEYVIKATREAHVHTSWQNPNDQYEDALKLFVASIVSDSEISKSVNEFVVPLVAPGYVNSLAALVLRLTMPGVPDTFQGSELWNLTLVDPDNRQPVDYATHRTALATINDFPVVDDDGKAKLFVLQKLLHLRSNKSETFSGTQYAPLQASGEKASHVVAFRRNDVVTVVPRLVHGLQKDWGNTDIDLGQQAYNNLFTGKALSGKVALAELLGDFPVAVLVEGDVRG